MVSRKADDDFDGKHGSIEPEADTRPGVYVQVSSTPRRRKASNKTSTYESGHHAVEDTRGAHAPLRRGPGPMGMGTSSASTMAPRVETIPPGEAVAPRETTLRSQSQVREKESVPAQREMRSEPTRARTAAEPARARGQIKEINQAFPDARAESENTNHRADIVRVSAPPASMSQPPPRISVPSVLDAPQRLHSDPAPVARTPWGLITLVAIMSAIIAAAGAVALLEWRQGTRQPTQSAAPDAESPTQAEGPSAPRSVSVKAKAPVKPAAAPPVVARPPAPQRVNPAVVPTAANAEAPVMPNMPAPSELVPGADPASPGQPTLGQPVPEQPVAVSPGAGTATADAPAPTAAPNSVPVAAAPVPARVVAPVAAPAPVTAEPPAELPANPFEQNP